MSQPVRLGRGALLLVAALLPLAATRPAQAADDPEAERRTLMLAATRARAESDHAAALASAERAHALRPSASLERFLAEELLALHRPIQAHQHATACVVRARAEPASANSEIVSAGCQQLREQLRARLVRLRVELAGAPPPGCRFQVSERASSLSCAELPLDQLFEPGVFDVRVSAPGYVDWREQVQLAAGEERSLELKLESARPANEPPSAPRGAFSMSSSAAPPVKPDVRRLPHWVGPVVIGLGALGVVTSGVLFATSETRYQDLKSRCQERACTGAAGDRSEIERLDTMSGVALGVGLGLGALGTAVIVF